MFVNYVSGERLTIIILKYKIKYLKGSLVGYKKPILLCLYQRLVIFLDLAIVEQT